MRDLCSGDWRPADQLPPDALSGALLRTVAAVSTDQLDSVLEPALKQAGCIRLDHTGPGEPPLLVASLVGGEQGAILWQQNGEWRSQSTGSLEESPNILRQVVRDGLREIFLTLHISGTGNYGALAIFRLEGDRWIQQQRTKLQDHFSALALDGDHILMTFRNPGDAPLAWEANCCIPTDYQWLWQRQGGGFAMTAERRAPDPYFTLNAFFGALQKQKPEYLPRVATAEAVTAARKLMLDAPGVMTTPDASSDLFSVVDAELRHWSVLPAGLNGPPSAVSELSVRVEVSSGTVPAVRVHLVRRQDAWLVDALTNP